MLGIGTVFSTQDFYLDEIQRGFFFFDAFLFDISTVFSTLDFIPLVGFHLGFFDAVLLVILIDISTLDVIPLVVDD
jgi:hypothetical protein